MRNHEHHEYVVLGGGPAGVQLGYYLEAAKRDYVVLERGERAGTFFDVYPRHRRLISINKRFVGSNDPEFSLRHDWNSLLSNEYSPLFRDYDDAYFPKADNMVRYLNDFVAQHGIRLRNGVDIQSIAKGEDGYLLTDAAGAQYSCKCLIIATGRSQAILPDIPGIEHAECYSTMSIDADEFENKRVLIIGKGNSSFETADHLNDKAALIHLASPESIEMAWKTHYVGHLRAVNNTFLDTYQLKSQNAILDADILGIRREGDSLFVTFHFSHAEDEIDEVRYDRIIHCSGFRYDNRIFEPAAAPQVTQCRRFPEIGWDYASVNQPNIYFAGTITHSLDYGKSTSGFVHGFRYNCKALARILAERRHDERWPSHRVEATAPALAQAILDRVNLASSLWQQAAYMVDLFAAKDGEIIRLEDMPIGFARGLGEREFGRYLTVSLEYGPPIMGDPFRIVRSMQAERSAFLHPIIRLYEKQDCVATHHVLEDLEGDWTKPMHRTSLTAFLEEHLGAIGVRSFETADAD